MFKKKFDIEKKYCLRIAIIYGKGEFQKLQF